MNGEISETVELAYDLYDSSADKTNKCPIIFIHGFLWNKYMLRELAEAMCDTTQRQVYCIDLRCHDQSPFRECVNSDIIVEDIIRFMKERNFKKVAFVCQSFSSTFAYLVLLKKPEAVEKIVMVDHPPFLNYTTEVINAEVNSQVVAQNNLLKLLDPAITLSAAKRKLRSLSDEAKTEANRVFLQKAAYELIKVNNQFRWKTNHEHLLNVSKNIAITGKEHNRQGRSNHEILIIRCEKSTLVTDENFQAVLKDNPNASLKTITNTTHLLMFEKPEEFIEAVREFLL